MGGPGAGRAGLKMLRYTFDPRAWLKQPQPTKHMRHFGRFENGKIAEQLQQFDTLTWHPPNLWQNKKN
jgi:hypothetical protein